MKTPNILTPIADPIEYLVGRRFGLLPSNTAYPVRLSVERELRKVSETKRQAAQSYKADLEAKPKEEIHALYEAELAKHRAKELAKTEREEKARFFNQPSASADFDHWSKASYWTLDEAVALSFGKAPEIVKWEQIKQYLQVSPFAVQYGRVLDLARRAQQWGQLY